MRKLSILFSIAAILYGCSSNNNTKEERVGLAAKNGMVVSAHPLASEVGLATLKKGGNSFDAAIATMYSLAVVLPKAGNIGGGGFMIYRTASGETGTLDFREMAPSGSKRDMYLDESKEVIENKSLSGHLAAGVPGSVAGMDAIHKKFGSLPFKDLVQPSIDLAINGFELTKYDADIINRFQEDFIKHNIDTPFLFREKEFEAGEKIKFKDLGETLKRIRDNGRDGFYKGVTADLIVKEMERGGGIISKNDLENYKAVWREPLTGSYRGHKIISMPPPSSGGIALLQLLKGSEKFDFKNYGHNSANSIHIMTELMRRVFADRATHLGDMDYYDAPINELLDSSYIANRIADIKLDKATPSEEIKEGKVDKIESFETTHFSIVDKEGNAVAITTTLNSFFGCKVMVKGAGFFLNNEMDDFSIKPGEPNQFGLVGGEANAIEPGKRMLSSMTPTIIEKDNQLYMVLGTPGGSTIITNVYQTIVNVIDYKMSMTQAVDTQKIHAQWLPDEIILEREFPEKTIQELRTLGHKINTIEQIGRMQAILHFPNTEYPYLGAADITRTGNSKASGY